MFGLSFGKHSKTKQTRKPIQNRGKYRIVDGFGQSVIGMSSAENRTEDEILDPSKRAKLLDLTRNLVRNSSLFNTILSQMTTNVVSSCGGKVILSFQEDAVNKNLLKYFKDFTRNADFYNGFTFNHMLKRILREYVIGGECVLVFDDGVVENSGKMLLFESEEIVQTSEDAIRRHYGKGAYQVQGKVYNINGRHIGTVVSRSQRGSQEADPDKCWFLKKDPNASQFDNNWYHFSSQWREGRGVSQAASAIATIHQLEDLVTTELMASRKNAATFCWLTSKSKAEEEMPSTFDTDTDFESMSDEEVEQAAREEASQTQTISFQRARENSIVYEALPEDYDARQLDMKHPNDSVQTMVDWLANRCAATLGLSKVFATGNPEDGNYRANQLFSAPAIIEMQKELEKIADWAFYQVCAFNGERLSVDDMDNVNWTWKGIDDLDEVSHQNAINLKLRNMTATYKDILGANWKEQLLQTKYEIDWLKQHNLPCFAYSMISGGESSGAGEQDTSTTPLE